MTEGTRREGRSRAAEGRSGPHDAADRYARNLASRRSRGVRGDEELFMHLGHWDAPERVDGDLRAAQERLNDRVLELAALSDGLAVLDVGCGLGGTIAAMNARFRGMQLVGLNIDPAQLEIARAAVAPRQENTVSWVCADACAPPLEDASFDRVLAIECAVHFASRQRFFEEAARLLRPGGRLALTDFVPTAELRALRGADAIPFDVDRLVGEGLGPWPDFWGDGPSHARLAEAARLRPLDRIDATRETLPSYRLILGDAARPAPAAERPNDEGMRMLAWLQERRLLRMEYLSFAKP